MTHICLAVKSPWIVIIHQLSFTPDSRSSLRFHWLWDFWDSGFKLFAKLRKWGPEHKIFISSQNDPWHPSTHNQSPPKKKKIKYHAYSRLSFFRAWNILCPCLCNQFIEESDLCGSQTWNVLFSLILTLNSILSKLPFLLFNESQTDLITLQSLSVIQKAGSFVELLIQRNPL